MTWGKDLWDQFDNISVHTSRGIEFCEKFAQYTKERCAIENEYASKLKKLAKNYQIKKKDEETEWTTVKGLMALVAEVHDMAGQHETLADNLFNNVYKEILVLYQQTKQERKKSLVASQKQQAALQSQLQYLDKVKKQYEKSFKELERATEAYKKADADKHMSRADVEKAQNNMLQKQEFCEECRNEYRSELNKTNEYQRNHYQQLLPEIYDQIEEMESKRINKLKECLEKCASVEKEILPIISRCIQGMEQAADSVSSNEDIQIAIDKYKSGFFPPEDLPFEDLNSSNLDKLSNSNHYSDYGTNEASSNNSIHSNNNSTPVSSSSSHSNSRTENRNSISQSMRSKRKPKILNLFSGSKSDDSKEDFSHLPPNQQKKKLNQKIDSIRNSLAKETAERDGMLKMQDVYRQNPALGDASTLNKQLEENGIKMDKLRQELQKYENYLRDAETGLTNSTEKKKNVSPLSSANDKINYRASMVRTETSSSNNSKLTPIKSISLTKNNNNNNNNSIPDNKTDDKKNNNTINNNHNDDNNNSKDLVDNRQSYAGDQDSFDDIDDNEGEEDDADLQPIAKCVAIYPFDGPSDGSISMYEGEKFFVIEKDQGDGWLRVRRWDLSDEGFVPTSYVEIKPLN